MALFRYLTFEGGLATLKNGTLKITPPREFNDPFEAYFGLEAKASCRFREDGVKTQENISNLANQRGVVSFSRRHNLALMWAYYTDEHEGMVIEFDEKDDAFNQRYGESLEHVDYVQPEERPLIRDEPPYLDPSDRRVLRVKSAEWIHEEETRLIYPLNFVEVTTGKVNGRPAWFLKYPQSSVKAVYFGIRMSKEQKEVIAGSMVGWGFKNVRFVGCTCIPSYSRSRNENTKLQSLEVAWRTRIVPHACNRTLRLS